MFISMRRNNMGTFVKGIQSEIQFIVLQRSTGADIEIGRAMIETEEYLDPFRPAREVYLLVDDPPISSLLYLNVLFIPSENTLQRMRIEEPISDSFNLAYDDWILSNNFYVDKYGFIVPIGRYHPKIISPDILIINKKANLEESKVKATKTYNEYASSLESRVKDAIIRIPALTKFNSELQEQENFRPNAEEVFFKYKQMQLYLRNEARVKANEEKQEYHWTEYTQMVNENLKEGEQGDQASEQAEIEAKTKTLKYLFSIANNEIKKKERGSLIDLSTLCRLGISHSRRSQIWYDLLGVKIIEDQTKHKFKEEDFYRESLSTYENIKLISIRSKNIAFDQIDEDICVLNISNTPSRDDRGSIKNILKCYIIWQKISNINLCYSINFCYIIQRLLSIFQEEKAFWMFIAILTKMKDKLGIEESVMLNRKGMFRIITACLLSHTKHMMPEIFNKFTTIGLSIDFFLYDRMSCLFANSFPSDTLLRLWDLIFYEFSQPISEVMSKGLGYIVSTCIYLLNINSEQILMSVTEEELTCALNNSSTIKFDTEDIINDIFNKNSRSFDVGSWFARKLSGLNNAFNDAASFLDNSRNALEEDYDLVFEK